MLVLSLLALALLLACVLAGSSLVTVFLVQNQLQRLADQVALIGACQLNLDNRIGQMNNIVARCRQLVFASRQACELLSASDVDLSPLANQLLEEDRQNAQYLDKERIRLQLLSQRESKRVMEQYFDQQSGKFRILLPWLKVTAPRLVSLHFGYLSGAQSNVLALQGIDELVDFDRSSKYVQGGSNLYLGNADLKLPGEDSDLHFSISSLPAPVDGTIAPSRVILGSAFGDRAVGQLQSATRVIISARVAAGWFSPSGADMAVTTMAATNGASPFK